MVFFKGGGYTNAGIDGGKSSDVIKKSKAIKKVKPKCYWCKSPVEKGLVTCGKCEPGKKSPQVILKGDGFTRSTEFNRNNVDSLTGEVVDRKKFSFEDYD